DQPPRRQGRQDRGKENNPLSFIVLPELLLAPLASWRFVPLHGLSKATLVACGRSQAFASSVSMWTSSFQWGWVLTSNPSKVVGQGPSTRRSIRSRCLTP